MFRVCVCGPYVHHTEREKVPSTYRLPGLFHLPDAEILQRNDATWLLILKGSEERDAGEMEAGETHRHNQCVCF